jgi:hypothetical protein
VTGFTGMTATITLMTADDLLHPLTEIVVLTESDTLDCSDVVTGWSIAVKAIFE